LDEVVKLFRHAAVYGVGQIIGKVVAFLLIPLFTYYLSRSDFGTMEMLNQASTLIGMALGLGVANAVMRFYYSATDDHERRVIVSTGMVFGAVVGALILISCWVEAPLFAKTLLGTPGGATLIRLAAATLLFTFCADIGWTYLQTTQRSVLYVVLSQGFLLLSVGLNVYFVVVRKTAVVGVFWSSMLASGTIAAILLFVTIRNVGIHFSAVSLKKLLWFGIPLTPAWVAAFVMNFSDRFFLQHFRGLSDVGTYAVGYKFGFIVSLLVVQPFIMIWEPKSYEIAAKPNARQIFSRTFTVYSALLILLGLCISVPSREVFEVMLDHKFLFAYQLVPLIAFAYVAQGIGRFSEAALLIRNKTHILAVIGIVSAMACLAGNIVLIKFFGMWGGAASTFVTFVLFAVISYIYGQRHYPIEHDLKTFATLCLVAVGVLTASLTIPVSWPLWIRIIVKLALLLAFVCGLPKMGVISSDEFWELRSRIGVGWRRKSVAVGETLEVS
jgi:O-antigen/teichoic acid export membrane protein